MIVSSTARIDAHAQPNGSRYVVEMHTDDVRGVLSVGPYLAAPGFDVDARMASRAQEIAQSLADAEADALLGVD